ncbi:unnamed protein product [Camellia sinensis]
MRPDTAVHGFTLQKLMFGAVAVFDDELTEGYELRSGLVGKAQGIYVASSEGGKNSDDSLHLSEVHRMAVAE